MNTKTIKRGSSSVLQVMVITFLCCQLAADIGMASFDEPVPDNAPVIRLIERMREADVLGAAGELYRGQPLTRRKVSNILAIAMRIIENSREPVMGRDDLVQLSHEIMNYDDELAMLFADNMGTFSRQVIALDRMIARSGEPVTRMAREDRERERAQELIREDDIPDLKLMEKRSLAFVDADVRHVLRTIFTDTDFNLALSDDVRGRITIQFRDVTLLDALESVLEQVNLTWQIRNRIISVFPKTRRISEKFEIRHISEQEAEGFFQRWKTPAGIVQKDPTGRVFVIEDTWETIQKIRELLSRYDIHRPEVESVLELIHLKHTEPSEMHRLVTPLLSQTGRIDINTRMKGLVIRDKRRYVERIKEVIAQLDVENEVVATHTEIIRLRYATAADMMTLLRSDAFAGQDAESRVGMVADERTNSIVLTGRPDRLRELKRHIDVMDARVKQVSVQAKIMEITLNDSIINGIDWETVIPSVVAKKSFGDGDLSNATENYVDINLSSGGSQRVQFGTLSYEQFHAVLDFLETRSNVKTVSTPTVITADNHPAQITLGATILFQLTGGEQATMQQQETGISLNVTPSINPDNYITMYVQPEVSSPGAVTETGDLTIDQLNLDTKVVVRDRETLMMGGLIRENESYVTRRVPFLGDVPILGNLFRDRNKSSERKEIVMFITPRIIHTESDTMTEKARRQYYGN